MSKILVAVAIVLAVQLVTPAPAIFSPLTKDQCEQMTGTTWDDSQADAYKKCAWNPLVKEGCEKLAGRAWDQAQGKCVQKEAP
jgi:hypothetical protein